MLHRGAEALLARLEDLFVLLALGQVAGDDREAVEPAGLVIERGDAENGPEFLAALAPAPALDGDLPLLGRLGEQPLRQPVLSVTQAEEPVERLAEDFRGGIAFVALGAGIPTANAAVAAQHVDRRRLDRFDERAETAAPAAAHRQIARLVLKHARCFPIGRRVRPPRHETLSRARALTARLGGRSRIPTGKARVLWTWGAA